MTTTLTREQILAMPAGRELDALVAERVMEWKPCSDPRNLCDDAHTTPVQCWVRTGDDYGSHLPLFSKDIAAAWLVVEASIGRVDLSYCKGEGDWQCYLRFRRGFATAQGQTAPLAICRASLLATL